MSPSSYDPRPSIRTRRPPLARRSRRTKRYSGRDVLALLEGQRGIAQWYQRLDPVTELVFTILSQHTSDLNSERAGQDLRKKFGTWEAVVSAPMEEVEEAIRSAGLARQKAPRIQGTLSRILELEGSFDLEFLRELPLAQAKAWLRALPGVGPKTAAIVLCFALGMPAMAVDTHVHRVARRLGLIGAKVTAEQAHDLLEPMVQPEEVYRFHVALITHGRRTCKAQRPLCGECVLREKCPSRRE